MPPQSRSPINPSKPPETPSETPEKAPESREEYVPHDVAQRTAIGGNSAMFFVLRELDGDSGMEIYDIGSSLEEVQEIAQKNRAVVVLLPLLADYRS